MKFRLKALAEFDARSEVDAWELLSEHALYKADPGGGHLPLIQLHIPGSRNGWIFIDPIHPKPVEPSVGIQVTDSVAEALRKLPLGQTQLSASVQIVLGPDGDMVIVTLDSISKE